MIKIPNDSGNSVELGEISGPKCRFTRKFISSDKRNFFWTFLVMLILEECRLMRC